MARIQLRELEALIASALTKAGASEASARASAKALVFAEAQGLASHGASRVPLYAAHIRNGRAEGKVVPEVARERGAALLVDAKDGMAYPACELAVQEAIRRARTHGLALAAVARSNHFGVAAYHLEAIAAAGLVGLAFSNSPAALPAAGGKRALFGTNPIAAAFPRKGKRPVMIDLSLSEVARGKLLVAAKKGEKIPFGWALDKHGNPTTDPNEGLNGIMLTMGGAKGAMLALLVEVLTTALTGSQQGFEAEGFFSEKGNKARLGQVFLAIDPGAFAGEDVYAERLETLLAAMLADEGVRVPGERRDELARRAAREGVEVPDGVLSQIRELAG
jgi:(2R)-3-sulfolactate dehydrogenase (NADP+)